MSSYQRLELKKLPDKREYVTAEGRYWRKFRDPVVSEFSGPVTHLSYCPVAPHELAVSAATAIALHDASTGAIRKRLTKFRDTVYSAQFRADGKLLVAGGEEPLVQVFEPNNRLPLRSFRGHQNAVRVTRWTSDITKILSCSDDKTVRGWDLPSSKQIHCFEGHTDYVRCGFESPVNPALWVSASYDHTVRLWDTRLPANSACVQQMNHGSPVQDAVLLASGSLLVSAGDTSLKVWDFLGGGRLVHEMSHHQKAITALTLDSASGRLLSASLDHMVHMYDTQSYAVVHSTKYPDALLSVALSPDSTRLAVGCANGQLIVRRRELRQAESMGAEADTDRKLRGGSYKYFIRGQQSAPSEEDYKVEHVRAARLKPYDVFLKKFQYHDALNAALESRHPVIVVSLLDELSQRGSLSQALARRDDVALGTSRPSCFFSFSRASSASGRLIVHGGVAEPVLHFLIRHITNPHYARLLQEVAHLVLGMSHMTRCRLMVFSRAVRLIFFLLMF